MSRIGVLGLGNFGTALARTWCVAGHDVVAWTVEQEVYDSLQATQINEKYLPGVELTGIRATMDLQEAIADREYVVLALPSSVVIQVAQDAIPHLGEGQVLLDLAKGLGADDQLISDEIKSLLAANNKSNALCVMMGPSIAPELARGVYTIALVACDDIGTATTTAAALTTSTLKLSAADDPDGAEYWGAFKNVIALACGVADGLKDSGSGGDNLKAAIFTRGFAEAHRVLPLLGAAPETTFTAAGIGDLFVTAASPHGRNRSMGERLGRGMTLEEAQGETVMVSEGVRAARMFKRRFDSMGIESHFVATLCQLLDGELAVDVFVDQITTWQG